MSLFHTWSVWLAVYTLSGAVRVWRDARRPRGGAVGGYLPTVTTSGSGRMCLPPQGVPVFWTGGSTTYNASSAFVITKGEYFIPASTLRTDPRIQKMLEELNGEDGV